MLSTCGSNCSTTVRSSGSYTTCSLIPNSRKCQLAQSIGGTDRLPRSSPLKSTCEGRLTKDAVGTRKLLMPNLEALHLNRGTTFACSTSKTQGRKLSTGHSSTSVTTIPHLHFGYELYSRAPCSTSQTLSLVNSSRASAEFQTVFRALGYVINCPLPGLLR